MIDLTTNHKNKRTMQTHKARSGTSAIDMLRGDFIPMFLECVAWRNVDAVQQAESQLQRIQLIGQQS
ncbi:hypothetical protein IVA80_26400 [Bradyrhizobium sp. 139]|uniref:hypothetical protein n=1 Tax=Bradyrhizobium sp. 139 TaxID=2782616 RepID=UPI001FF9C430|nr:hypothetical protein [Bradyrhizobium sp. 139]MCK1744268.1 hypothetical protein [Bradyrhizobium sp. 139]